MCEAFLFIQDINQFKAIFLTIQTDNCSHVITEFQLTHSQHTEFANLN